MSQSPRWILDEARGLHFYYDERDDSLVYEDRTRVPRPAHIPRETYLQHPGASTQASQPFFGTSPTQHGRYVTANMEPVVSLVPTRGAGGAAKVPGYPSVQPDRHPEREASVSNVNAQMRRMSLSQQRSPAAGPVTSDLERSEQRHGPIRTEVRQHGGIRFISAVDTRTGISTVIGSGPPQLITDEVLLALGITAHRALYGDGGEVEPLFSEYRTRPHRFFAVGRVFMTLWVEPAGTSFTKTDITKQDISDRVNSERIDPALRQGRFGEHMYQKVRRFVVIRAGDDYCSALPIVSYGGQGVSKRGVNKTEHAIIFSGRTPPDPKPSEIPARGQDGMRPIPIRVVPDDSTDQLDPMSRIDFGKVHTIHHNLKVKSYGTVYPKSEGHLISQFDSVWHVPSARATSSSSQVQLNEAASPSQITPSSSSRGQAGSTLMSSRVTPNSAGYQRGFAGPSTSRQDSASVHSSSAEREQLHERRRSEQAQQEAEARAIVHALRGYKDRGYSQAQAYEGVARDLMDRREGLTRPSAMALIQARVLQARNIAEDEHDPVLEEAEASEIDEEA